MAIVSKTVHVPADTVTTIHTVGASTDMTYSLSLGKATTAADVHVIKNNTSTITNDFLDDLNPVTPSPSLTTLGWSGITSITNAQIGYISGSEYVIINDVYIYDTAAETLTALPDSDSIYFWLHCNNSTYNGGVGGLLARYDNGTNRIYFINQSTYADTAYYIDYSVISNIAASGGAQALTNHISIGAINLYIQYTSSIYYTSFSGFSTTYSSFSLGGTRDYYYSASNDLVGMLYADYATDDYCLDYYNGSATHMSAYYSASTDTTASTYPTSSLTGYSTTSKKHKVCIYNTSYDQYRFSLDVKASDSTFDPTTTTDVQIVADSDEIAAPTWGWATLTWSLPTTNTYKLYSAAADSSGYLHACVQDTVTGKLYISNCDDTFAASKTMDLQESIVTLAAEDTSGSVAVHTLLDHAKNYHRYPNANYLNTADYYGGFSYAGGTYDYLPILYNDIMTYTGELDATSLISDSFPIATIPNGYTEITGMTAESNDVIKVYSSEALVVNIHGIEE